MRENYFSDSVTSKAKETKLGIIAMGMIDCMGGKYGKNQIVREYSSAVKNSA